MIRGIDDEASCPKYAHIERERRWLIDPAQSPSLDDLDGTLIEDRYLTGTRIRLRRMSDGSGRVALKLTKKYEADDPLARPIVTAYLTEQEYALFAVLPAAPLVKRRVAVTSGGIAYSFDVFGGGLAGLVLAENEQLEPVALTTLPPPPAAMRDVSNDVRYQGASLAIHGIPKE